MASAPTGELKQLWNTFDSTTKGYNDLVRLDDGSYIVVGGAPAIGNPTPGATDGLVEKYSKEGILIWSRRLDASTFPFETATTLARTGDTIYVGMRTVNNGAMGLAKLSAIDGAPLWNPVVLTYGLGFPNGTLRAVLTTGTTVWLVHTLGTMRINAATGQVTNSFPGGGAGKAINGDIYVLSPGDVQQNVTLRRFIGGGTNAIAGTFPSTNAIATDLAVGPDGSAYIPCGAGVCALNPDLQTSPWPYYSSSEPRGATTGVRLDPSGNPVLVFETSSSGSRDIGISWISKVTGLPLGDIVTYDNEDHGNNYPYAFEVGPGGDVFIASETEDFYGTDVYYSWTILWFGANGVLNAAYRDLVDGQPSMFQYGTALSIEPTGEVTVVGRSDNSVNPRGIGRLAKYATDRDGDGLLDSWERDGLTVDGYRLDLKHDFGVRIDHKDLLLEVDMMDSVSMPIDGALQDVQAAFAAAPNALVHNPDGQDGIALHLLVEPDAGVYSRPNLWLNEDTVPATIFTGEADLLTRYVTLREASFGTVAERAAPNWAARKKAREMVTRYMLIGDRRTDRPGLTGQSEVNVIGGKSLGGNDGIVFGECSVFTSINNATPAATAKEQQDALAATIMHELGHMIGLQHGGNECVNYKPQYHSVMNYSYQVPVSPVVGAPYAFGWRLDYSHNDTAPISEGALIESQGLRGAVGSTALQCELGPLNASSIASDHGAVDFDRDTNINPDAATVSRDLNHFDTGACGGDGLQTYHGFNDWSHLVYLRNDTAQWQDHTLGDEAHGVDVEPEYDDNVKARLMGKCNHLPIGDSCVCTVPSSKACGGAVGTCVPGVQTCNQGIWSTCVGGVPPRFEKCDGADDDCDGTVDEDFPTKGEACSVGTGACTRSGTLVCKADGSGVVCSASPGAPATETCNGIDDDCDGLLDEDNPGGGALCDGPDSDFCQGGTMVCTSGSLVCNDTAPTQTERCNGIDDDCDGLVDEGYAGNACTVGLGACRRSGVFYCTTDGQLLCNVNPGTPSAEICNNIDDDCNGVVDNNPQGAGVACDGSDGDLCPEGTTFCSGGVLSCSDNTGTNVETCNGLDDNCNGQIDEGNPDGGAACDGNDGDACAEGTYVCSGGHLVCNDNTGTNVETCNGLDDNCNGQIDEGNPGGGVACDGPDGDLCAEGVTVCASGAITCNDATSTNVEICNGLDDNCNGQIDEGNPGGGVACDGPDGDACAEGITACSGGTITCSDATGTNVEICNGLDDNCNGAIDDGVAGTGVACDGSDGDQCKEGIVACSGGVLLCTDTSGDTIEACNNADDDCDGAVDEGNPGGGVVCSTGQLGVCAAGTTLCSAGNLSCVRNQGPALEICGNGVDENCNGNADDACDTPSLTKPWNGSNTGAVGTTSAQLARRPVFLWASVNGSPSSFQIQIDDTCPLSGYASCTFPSPEVDTSVATSSFQPTSGLPVATTAPVGRRYFWHVRACGAASCSAWSPVRYLNVGRLEDDFNGDGFSDLIVGSPMVTNPNTYQGMAFTFAGSSTGLAVAIARTLANPLAQAFGLFGMRVAALGDVNGDGYADAAVAAKWQNTPINRAGAVYIYLGGSGGLAATAARTLANPLSVDSGHFGSGLAGVGDLNGDGYTDLAVGAPDNGGGGKAYLYLGGASGVAATAWTTLSQPDGQAAGSYGLAIAGDFDANNDGFADLVIADPYGDYGALDEGAAFVYTGSASGVSSPRRLESSTNQASAAFGTAIAVGDLNGDGFGDVVVGAPHHDSTGAANAGAAFVYLGNSTGVAAVVSRVVQPPNAQTDLHFGTAIAAGNFNRDGYDDVAIGGDGFDSGGLTDRGSVWVWLGGTLGLNLGTQVQLLGANFASFGDSLGVADVNGDGFFDLAVGANLQSNPETSEGNVFTFHGGTAGIAGTPSTSLDNPRDQPYETFGSSLD